MRIAIPVISIFANKIQGVPVYGGMSDFGYYFTDITIGTPPQRMSVIIDTGSDGLSVACTTCESCGKAHLDPFYNPDISTSFEYLEQCPVIHLRNPTCTFEKRYLEGSMLKGRIYADKISVTGSGVDKKIDFGCIETETKLFLDQKANGIMGFSASPATHYLFSHEPRIVAFTLCFANAGGEIDLHSLVEKPDGVVRLQYQDKHYVVVPTEISVSTKDGVSLWTSANSSPSLRESVGSKMLIDSGSTITYFKQSFFSKLMQLINERLPGEGLVPDSAGPTQCWIHPSGLDISVNFPVIEIKLEREDRTGSVATRMKNYITKQKAGGDSVKSCLTIASNGNLDRTDLGASWLLNKQVTFTTGAGWMQVIEKTCPEHPISSREMVIPLEGQLTRRTHASTRLGVIAVIAFFSLILIIIVKKNTSNASATITAATE